MTAIFFVIYLLELIMGKPKKPKPKPKNKQRRI